MESCSWREVRRALSAGAIPADVAGAILDRLEMVRDPAIWIGGIDPDSLAAEARRVSWLSPDLPLYGLPFAVKDNIDVAGVATTAACPAYTYVADVDADSVARIKAAGGLFVGKTNMDQFATGLVGTRSPYGIPTNPYGAHLVPGGSSSGSAVAVARELVAFSLGTDTAGSGRVPAGFNNVVGLKPTPGMVSTRGVVPACRSLDCVSVFAATVSDAHEVFAVIRSDSGCLDPVDPSAPVVVGIPMAKDLDFAGDACAAETFQIQAELIGRCIDVRPVDLADLFEVGASLYGGPWVAERYAAVGAFVETHGDEVIEPVRSIILGGANHSAADVFRAQYALADQRTQSAQLWKEIDVLVVPTTPTIPTLEAVALDPIGANATLGRYTDYVNLLEMAALAIPGGFRSDGVPCGATLQGPAGSDLLLAQVGERLDHEGFGSLGAHP